MEEELGDFIDSKFQVPVVEGEDKVCSLEEAIKRNVREGMVVHLASQCSALHYQLVREFWGKKPGFTIVCQSISGPLLALVLGRLMKKAVVSFAGNGYPSPSPNLLVQKAYDSGEIEFENWTMRTVSQRLLAGAMGWGFIPTKSLLGSSMEVENKESFIVMEDPFNQGEKIGLMRALRPDITLIHGVAADRCGNTIMTYPLGIDAFGAWGAKNGVIVSVEKIVSTEYIRRCSHLVRIPSYMVRAVCEVPYGAHPAGVTHHGLPEFEAYCDDYDFMAQVTEAAKDEKKFSRWVEDWVLNREDHNDYLSKLGKDRLLYLKGKADPNAWVAETMSEIRRVDFKKQPNSLERMVVAGSRIIAEKCISEGYKTILAGIGLPNLSAWLAVYALKERGYMVDLMAEIGVYGFLPRPSEPFVFSYLNLPTCKILTNIDTTLGLFVGGSENRCIGVLGAAQADKFGNVNSTKIPGQAYLVGSGGANDVASTTKDTVVVVNSGKQRLVEEVPYITFPGKNVRTLVTDVGIFEKIGDRETFTLTAYIPSETGHGEEEAIAAIKERVGWKLEFAPDLKEVQPPTKEEITMLRLFDPKGYFIKK